jgi:parallel beta-helix repeat protein
MMLMLGRILHLTILLLLYASILQSGSTAGLRYEKSHSAAFQSNTIMVPDDYATIKEALDAAEPGDTVQVRGGIYHENIAINKTVSLIGENPESTIIDGSGANETFAPVVSIFGEQATNVRICNFTLRGSAIAWGVDIGFKANAWIENNIVTSNSGGILLDFSDNNTIVNNTISGNKYEGLALMDSHGNTVKNNTMSANQYNFGIISSSFDSDIDTSNLVNGKPVYYLRNQTNLDINPNTLPNIGYLALIDCTNVTVQDLTLQNNLNGLLLADTTNSVVKNNTFNANSNGLEITDSANNDIEANNVTNNYWYAVTLSNSPNNRFRSNGLINNRYGLKVSGESLSDFTQDIDTSNTADGKHIQYLINRTDLTVNPSTFNDTAYLALVNCQNITAQDLELKNSELLVAFTHNSSIIENTLTNTSMSLTYCSSIRLTRNRITDGETGISLRQCENITVAWNTALESQDWGLLLKTSSNNTIFGNDIRNNGAGINLIDSEYNKVFENNITDNKDYGLLISDSSHNLFYHNNLINQIPYQAISFTSNGQPFSDNDFDNGYPSGGNYWSNYNGTDLYSGQRQNETGSDGVGDTRYTSFNVGDRYPLMEPIESFEVITQKKITDDVEVMSNSTISSFELNSTTKTIRFNATGQEDTTGFSRITIPNTVIQDLWAGNYSVTINGIELPFRNWTDAEDTYIYINYTHSENEIVIVPQLPETSILIIFAVQTILAGIAVKKLKKPSDLEQNPT